MSKYFRDITPISEIDLFPEEQAFSISKQTGARQRQKQRTAQPLIDIVRPQPQSQSKQQTNTHHGAQK